MTAPTYVRIVLLLLGAAFPGLAQPRFELGDVIVTAQSPAPGMETTYKVLWYDSSGRLKGEPLSRTAFGNFVRGVAFSPGGILHVASADGVLQLSAGGSQTLFYRAPQGLYLSALSFASDSTLFAGAGPDLVRVGSSGTELSRFSLPDYSLGQNIDLARDQCTLYYLKLNALARFDVCRNTPLTDVITFSGSGRVVNAFRIMPDGTFLITKGGILRVDTTGQIVRQYPFQGGALALDVGAASVWVQDNVAGGTFWKLDLATGNMLVRPIDTGMQFITSITVFGEPRAALANGPVAAIPTLRWWMLGVLAAGLMSVALWRVLA